MMALHGREAGIERCRRKAQRDSSRRLHCPYLHTHTHIYIYIRRVYVHVYQESAEG